MLSDIAVAMSHILLEIVTMMMEKPVEKGSQGGTSIAHIHHMMAIGCLHCGTHRPFNRKRIIRRSGQNKKYP